MNLRGSLGGVLAMKSLQRWNIALAALYLIQAVIILVIAKSSTLPVSVSFFTTDSLQVLTTDSKVWAPALQHVLDLNLAYVVAAILLIGAVATGSQASWWRPSYESQLEKRRNWLRWVSYALAVGLLFVLLGVLVGVYDIGSLLSIFLLALLSALAFGAAEAQADKKRGSAYSLFLIGCAAAIAAWLPVLLGLGAHALYAVGALESYIYILAGAMALIGLLFAWLTVRHIRRPYAVSRYRTQELHYLLASFISLSALAWLVTAGALL